MAQFARNILAILTLSRPAAALADVSPTLPLNSGQNLDLDTGAIVTAGGDLLYNASGVTRRPETTRDPSPPDTLCQAGSRSPSTVEAG